MENLIKCKSCFQLLSPDKYYFQTDSPTKRRSKCKQCYNRHDYLSKKSRKAQGQSKAVSPMLVERNFKALQKAFNERKIDFKEFKIPTKFVNAIEPMSDGISFKGFKEGEHTAIIRTNGESAIKDLSSFPLDHIADFLARHEIEVVS